MPVLGEQEQTKDLRNHRNLRNLLYLTDPICFFTLVSKRKVFVADAGLFPHIRIMKYVHQYITSLCTIVATAVTTVTVVTTVSTVTAVTTVTPVTVVTTVTVTSVTTVTVFTSVTTSCHRSHYCHHCHTSHNCPQCRQYNILVPACGVICLCVCSVWCVWRTVTCGNDNACLKISMAFVLLTL